MARRRGTRDADAISNQRLRSEYPTYRQITPSSVRLVSLRDYEDRRQYHPEGTFAPARRFSSTRHRLMAYGGYADVRRTADTRSRTPYGGYADSIKVFSHLPQAVGFTSPKKVLICVRRQQRREVLHALRETGRGSGGQKRAKWSEYSSVRCK